MIRSEEFFSVNTIFRDKFFLSTSVSVCPFGNMVCRYVYLNPVSKTSTKKQADYAKTLFNLYYYHILHFVKKHRPMRLFPNGLKYLSLLRSTVEKCKRLITTAVGGKSLLSNCDGS